jgi:serine/threonine-protein kinase
VTALKVCPQCGTEYPANARFCEIDGTALRSGAPTNDLVGSIVADRYCILKKLGEGGMGQVYLAEHVKMGRKNALKVMHPAMKADVDAISRFNREAANASRITHPNVASVYDFGETTDGIIYLAMEFIDGPPLTSVIEQQGALPPKRAADIVRQTADALAVAHDMGIVHRDLKPDNIMLARTRDGGDLVKVVDFGIAKAAGNEAQKVTKTGLVVGTPEYMSPEQLSGDKLDGRSDIYSLGLVAYNMLTGKLPFPSESAQESMIVRLTDKPKPLAEMKADRSWPADVQAVMDKALERDVTKRYQHATDFGMALYNAIDRMPETIAAEMGTAVMGAIAASDVVPPTRVAAAPSAPAAATVAMAAPGSPATVGIPAASPVTQSAAPPAKRKNVPLMAAGAVAVVVLAIVGAKLASGGGAPAADPNAVVTAQGAAGTAGASAGDTTAAPPASSAPGAVTSPAGGASTPGSESVRKPAATPPAPTLTLEQRLSRLETAADDSTLADSVLAALPHVAVTAPDDRARINFIRFKAYTSKYDAPHACDAINQAVQDALSPELKTKYRNRALGCS